MPGKILIAVALGLGTVAADTAFEEEKISSLQVEGKTVDIYRIGELSMETVDMDVFAGMVAPHLRRYTAHNNVEACAMICQTPGRERMGTVLVTIKSAAACPKTTACPCGMSPTHVDIHSHLHVRRYTPSGIDRIFLDGHIGPGEQVGTRPDEFSESDLVGGAGYMASRHLLQYQDGEGRIRRVTEALAD